MRWIFALVASGFVTQLLAPALAAAQPIVLEPLITSLPSPPTRHAVGLVNAGDGSGRLFIVVQEGEILIHDGAALVGTPFLDIRSRVLCCGERGLLGLAFHPQYESNGFFFVYYTDLSGANVLARFKRSATDADLANPDSGVILFSDTQPGANHNGGQLQFGPDGFLYVGKGDGGSSSNGQSLGTRLGKVLRVQPSLGTTPPFYTVPSTNPFVGVTGARPEIWAYGLRNPWRFSFDRQTGDLLLADVGQDRVEEVNFQAAGSPGGQNYGWNRMEGSLCFIPSTNCNPDGTLVLPILEYDHALGCSVIGGYRYRGPASPALFGTYLFGDLCGGPIWGATEDGAGHWTATELLSTGLTISSFGEAENGEVYVVDHDGAIYRIVAATSGGPDLVIEALTASPTSVAAGGQVTLSYRVANRGSTTVGQTYTDRIYLSADQTLGGDVLLGTSHGHTADLAAGGTHAHTQAVTIPASTPSGTRFILVQADGLGAVVESNEGNNVAAVPITVTAGGPDLVIEALALSSGSVGAGSSVTVSYRVANRGGTTVTTTYTDRIYLSTNATLGTGDVLIGTSHGHTTDLPGGGTHAHSQAVAIPAGTASGPYFILVQADAPGVVAETNEGNNVTAVPVTVTARADLVIENLTLSSSSVRAGGTVVVSYRVANRGGATVTTTYTDRFFLAVAGGGETLIGTSHGHTTDLPPGATHAHSQSVTIPAETAPASYSFRVRTDVFGFVSESNETNNTSAVPLTVTP